MARACRADREPQRHVHHSGWPGPAGPRPGEPGLVERRHTDHRGHAIEIAEAAKRDGIDVIIVHGGDGTVNEVVNGLLGRPGPERPAVETLPAVAVVPGGSANVFARALGISPDPVEATNQLIDLLGERQGGAPWRRIGLMDCAERWAVFTAGMGVDGDVVAAVEAQRAKGRKVTAGRYMRIAFREMLSGVRTEPLLTLHLPTVSRPRACISPSCPMPARGPTRTAGRCGPTRGPPSRAASAFSPSPA